ncbi:hypothetical protein KIPB_006005 [Kipferlia bialata]|uniref:Phospholipid/glycerol acyltransferase domain-containing protein n=1 Tax=Kipferlia bialata TaxID=797122 RepID=A0A9K3CYQ2_9EUKA|nr:hypothetical protein KIPB_006005 [Kipferlia bialata]|eukprot:g6005.t1
MSNPQATDNAHPLARAERLSLSEDLEGIGFDIDPKQDQLHAFLGKKHPHSFAHPWEMVKVGFWSLLWPVRMLVLWFTLIYWRLAGVFYNRGLSTAPQVADPMDPRRRAALNATSKRCARILLYCLGFMRLRVTTPLPSADAVIPCVMNHVSWLDLVVCNALSIHSFVVADTVRNSPLIGGICGSNNCITVHRDDRGSCIAAAQLLEARNCVKDGSGYGRLPACPVSVFPEGHATNGSCIARFKSGAFRNGPVQPVAISYPHRFYNASQTSQNVTFYLFKMMTQVYNRVQVSFLPVMSPLPEEAPAAFAFRCQKAIASHLGVPTSRHSVSDALQYDESRRASMAPSPAPLSASLEAANGPSPVGTPHLSPKATPTHPLSTTQTSPGIGREGMAARLRI